MRRVSIRPSIRALIAAVFFSAAITVGSLAINGVRKRAVEYSARGGPIFVAKQDQDSLAFWTIVSIYAIFSLSFATLGMVQASQVFRQSRPPSKHERSA